MTNPPPHEPGHVVFHTLDRVTKYPYSRGEYVRRLLWQLVQATLFRWSLPRAYRWRRFLLRCFGADLHPKSGVQSTVKIVHPWLLQLGEWSILSHGVVVYNLGAIKIGRHSVVSQESYLCAGTHDYTQPTLPLLRVPIRIGDGVWIAAQVFVGPGVTIGNNSVIGARAVVIKDIPEGVVAAGNPCCVVKPRTMNLSPDASASGGQTA